MWAAIMAAERRASAGCAPVGRGVHQNRRR